jgi:hypothetical protein
MKKIFSLLFLIAICYSISAQERTVDLNSGLVDITVKKNIAYNGTTSDRLIPTTRDTIDYYVQLSNYGPGPLHFYAVFTFDTIAGADTTIAITVQEKKFASQTYTDIIASSVTSAITAEAQVVKTSLGVISEFTETVAGATDIISAVVSTNKDTVTVAARSITRTPNTLIYYKYLKFRLILQGNDNVGTGIRVKRVELQFFQ